MDEPLYDAFDPSEFGLSPSEWEVSIDKCKTPFGRRVIVHVRNRHTGRTANDSVVGGRLTKRELQTHATRMIKELVKALS